MTKPLILMPSNAGRVLGKVTDLFMNLPTIAFFGSSDEHNPASCQIKLPDKMPRMRLFGRSRQR